MKLFKKLILALLVLSILLPFTLLKNERGQPLMSFSDFSLPEFNLPDFSVPELPSMPSAKKLVPSAKSTLDVDTFYQWYETDGTLQLTSEPPPAGIDYVVKQIDPNVNVVPSVRMPRDEDDAQAAAGAAPIDAGARQDLGNPYDPDSINKLFEKARNVEQQIQQRLGKQNSTIN